MEELSPYTLGSVNVATPVNRNHPLNRGLVSWWLVLPGLAGGPNWFDVMGNNTGVLTNMGNSNNGWRATPDGFGSMLFDGTAGYVNIGSPSSLKTTYQFTVSAWVKPTFRTSRFDYPRISGGLPVGGVYRRTLFP